MANNKPRISNRKSWFDKQAERKGQNFLDGWANGADREFATNDGKIRAINNILRDYKDGYIDMQKDWTTQRALHPDLLCSIVKFCGSNVNYMRRQMDGFEMIESVNNCICMRNKIDQDLGPKIATTSAEELQSYLKNNIPAEYHWVAYCPSMALIPKAMELHLEGNVLTSDYANQKWVCEVYRNLYNWLAKVFDSIYKATLNNMFVSPTVVQQIEAGIKANTSFTFPGNLNVRLPLDFNVLIGQSLIIPTAGPTTL